jgi:hypothetical protein
MALWGMGTALRAFGVWRVIANNQPLKKLFLLLKKYFLVTLFPYFFI